MTNGAVAAGHPLTAEAGAAVLREGGNAVDAAICSVLTSFVTESPMTGLGAGGFMLVHDPPETTLLDFFVETPGRRVTAPTGDLVPIEIVFDDMRQVFNIGAAACGVPGNPAGLVEASRRFGSVPMPRLAAPAVALAREGAIVNGEQAYVLALLETLHAHHAETAALYNPGGKPLGEGDCFRFPDLADSLERLGDEGAEPFYRGDIAARVSDWVLERGGNLAQEDMAAYEVVAREPVRARFRDRDVLNNPPPSSGGVLVAFALELLERLGDSGLEEVVATMAEAHEARTPAFDAGLNDAGLSDELLAAERLDRAAESATAHIGRAPGAGAGAPGTESSSDELGSTTHLTAIDGEGRCATVTCSNGTGSGMLVPGTGVHVNNMLGEGDLNPLGFHTSPPGRRVTSMMAPTVVLDDGELVAGLGSAGSSRIRSAILQTIARLVDDGLSAQASVDAARVHLEAGLIHAEPGVDEAALSRLEVAGASVRRWKRRNLYFGGCQTVTRDPSTGELSGGGDPRRGGAVAVA
jgi:gamma-glutamyltranspeptidase/glutathione hydrolase